MLSYLPAWTFLCYAANGMSCTSRQLSSRLPRRWLRNYNRAIREREREIPSAPFQLHCSHVSMPRMLSTCWHHFCLRLSKRVADPEINAVLYMLYARCCIAIYLLSTHTIILNKCVCECVCTFVYRLAAWNVSSSTAKIGPTAAQRVNRPAAVVP